MISGTTGTIVKLTLLPITTIEAKKKESGYPGVSQGIQYSPKGSRANCLELESSLRGYYT